MSAASARPHGLTLDTWNEIERRRKDCERVKAYQRKNRDKVRESRRKYRRTHTEQIRATRLKWAAKNRERLAERQREWRKRNPETFRASRARWRKPSPERMREYNRKYRLRHPERKPSPEYSRQKARAYRARYPERVRRQQAKYGDHPSLKWLLRKNPDAKPVCAVGGGQAHHADHIVPISMGGTDAITNLRPLCRLHNIKRGPKGGRVVPDEVLRLTPCGEARYPKI
jgi:hypothetical protein